MPVGLVVHGPAHHGHEPLTTGPGAVDPARSLQTTLRGIASVAAPTTLVSALLYYFGWVRTSREAYLLGLDDSLFGYSTQDYVLRSISSMYWPLSVGLVACMVGSFLHITVIGWAAGTTGSDSRAEPEERRLRLLRLLAAVLAGIGVVSLAVGMTGAFIENRSSLLYVAAPLGVTVSIILISYAVHLHHRFLRPSPGGEPTQELRSLRLFISSSVIVLLFLSLFWTVSRYAAVKGVDLAEEVERQLPSRPSVTVYSPKRLQLQPPVVETELTQENSSYRFAYTGLKLLFRSEHKFFLRPSDPAASDVNIVIAESPELRLEFVRTGS